MSAISKLYTLREMFECFMFLMKKIIDVYKDIVPTYVSISATKLIANGLTYFVRQMVLKSGNNQLSHFGLMI